MNLHKINFVKHAVFALAIPLWWACLSMYLNITYDCRIGIVGLSGMSCTQGSPATLVSFVLLGLPIAVLAVLYSIVAFILSITLPYEHNDDDDDFHGAGRTNRWFSIAKNGAIWILPIAIVLLASPPKSKLSAQSIRDQKSVDAISGDWLCHTACNAAFPAGDFFTISRHLSGALQLVGMAGSQLRSAHDIWPSQAIENNFTIEIANTSPPTIITAKFDSQAKTLSIENGKVLVQAPTATPIKK